MPDASEESLEHEADGSAPSSAGPSAEKSSHDRDRVDLTEDASTFEPIEAPLMGPFAEPLRGSGESDSGRKGGIAGRVKRGLVSMAAATYDARADDLQVRAVAAMRKALQEESERIIEVATDTYDRRADDLEERAVRAIRKVLEEETERFLNVAQSTYDARADDLEDRAVRALRRAMIEETRRIRSTIERSVQAKRREVRLSLLVLVLANLLYLLVYYLTTGLE